MKYYLYWIHNENHTNIFTEGYIGITNNPKRRYDAHKYKKQNPILENAFNKYKNLNLTILVVESKDYCKDLELKLRPHKEIGWNILPGGGLPPSKKGKSNPHTEESKQKIKNSWIKRKESKLYRQNYKHTSEIIEKIKNSNKNAKKFECEHCKKLFLKQHYIKSHGIKCKFKMEN